MRAIYVSPNGIGSALVRSQVLPYLRLMEGDGVDCALVTFERDEPYPKGEFPRSRWVGLVPRRGSGLLAKSIDVATGVLLVTALALRRRAAVLHARSYLPAAITAVVGALLRRPFVFDMRGFLGEEYVEAGNWAPGDLRYRLLRRVERILLARAAAIVVLTHRAEERLRSEPQFEPARVADITVIPCGVDLERFLPKPVRSPVPTLIYSGTLGMWYLLDEMLGVYARALALVPGLRFRIVNRNEHQLIHEAVHRLDVDPGAILVDGADFGEMPRILADGHVAIALLRQVRSKSGSSPIKIAEYLACGLPVVVNAELGDTADFVARYSAGHVVRAFTEGDLDRAADAVAHLISDPDARRNARRLAEREFDVRAGARAYRDIYVRIARGEPRRMTTSRD